MVYAVALTVNFEQGRSIVTADSLQFLHFQAGVNCLQFLDDSHVVCCGKRNRWLASVPSTTIWAFVRPNVRPVAVTIQ